MRTLDKLSPGCINRVNRRGEAENQQLSHP